MSNAKKSNNQFSRLRNMGPKLKAQMIALSSFFASLAVLVILYSSLFHLLMGFEGREYSLLTGLYWTLTTMSTLGFGDIVFESDLGKAFSIVVLLSGIVFMLVLLPFVFIRFVYEPWVEARRRGSVLYELPGEISDHVILTFYGPIARALIDKLRQFDYPYVVLLPEPQDVLELRDSGIRSICGDLDDPESYRKARVEQAAMVATTRSDIENTTVVFTVRGIAESVPVFATARETEAIDVLNLAGCTRALNLAELMGNTLARRTLSGRGLSQIIGRMDDILIAEVDAARTSLVDKTLGYAQEMTNVSVVGAWKRGQFFAGDETTVVEPNMLLVLAGTPAQLREFETEYRVANHVEHETGAVIIVGGGRVGRATAAVLKNRNVRYTIVEELPERISTQPRADQEAYVRGSAADKKVLLEAGIESAQSMVITTRDDELNVYLAIFARLLRPDLQIITRASLERSVSALHRAGADTVVSYASMGANSLFNLLKRSDLLMVAEGLDVLKVPVPAALAGLKLQDARIRERTECTVVGIDQGGETLTDPSPETVIPEGGEIILIGGVEGEKRFFREFHQ
ncbi:MAG: NAD-binding protein [Pseudomonadota bacterium]